MKRFIKDLREKDHFQTVFLATDKSAGTDRNGKSFLSLTVSDRTGQLNGRMFEKAGACADLFEVGDVVWIKGFVQLYQNRKQIIIHDVRRATEDEFNLDELVAEVSGDPREHLGRLLTVVDEVKDPHVKTLLRETLTAPDLQERLLKAPAAKTIHHAYRGGLLEHVLSITDLMRMVGTHYAFLDMDLLLFGAIYHDIGKLYELDIDEGIHYTHSGRMVGHITVACEMIDRFTAPHPDFPVKLKDCLKHIVLSHHGKLEYGSPKLPVFPEAMVVAMIDDLDSKMNTVLQFFKTEVQSLPASEAWSHYHPGFERYFYLDFFRRRVPTV